MSSVNKFILFVSILISSSVLYGQTSEKLKKEQQKLEKKISNTKSLLSKMKNNTEASLNELKVIENQITYREELVRNFDNQIGLRQDGLARQARLRLQAPGAVEQVFFGFFHVF